MIGLILAGIAWGLKVSLASEIQFSALLVPVLLVALVTIVFQLGLLQNSNQNEKAFLYRFLLLSALKVLIFCIAIVAFLLSGAFAAKPFVLSFLFSYLVFSISNVQVLLQKRSKE